jgi:hypothetical protein
MLAYVKELSCQRKGENLKYWKIVWRCRNCNGIMHSKGGDSPTNCSTCFSEDFELVEEKIKQESNQR